MVAKRANMDTQDLSPRLKKRKLSGQTFKEDYTKMYPDIIRTSKGSNYARCVTCGCDFTISHGGEYDIKKHLQTTKHSDNKLSADGSKKMDSFFLKQGSNLEISVTNAECLFTSFVVEHNLPISVADHATKLFPKMFSDSQIAKKYACARTKTTAIIGEMAASATAKTVSNLQSKVFNLATDGSNDVDSKLYPIVVSYFDDSEGKVVHMLLSNPNLVGKSTGENITSLLQKELSAKSLKWENVVSLGVDSANVMVGRNKGVAGLLLKLNPEMIIRGCPCHLLHLAAEKAAKKLHYQFDEILIDVYYYLDKSANRKQELHEFQNLCNVETHDILKHVCTRWLSLGKCLQRLIEQWRPLKHFFTEKHEEKKKTDMKAKDKVDNEKKTNSNRPSVIVHVGSGNNRKEAESSKGPGTKKNILKNEDLVIGYEVVPFLEKLEKENKIAFYEDVKTYYQTALVYMKLKFPLQDEALKHAEIADVKLRKEMSMKSVEYFAKKFKPVLSDKDTAWSETMNSLQKQFLAYQIDPLQGIDMTLSINTVWKNISELKNELGQFKYDKLSVLMKSVLVIPHSNAGCERIFSLVRKNRTDFRGSMSNDTLEAFLIRKQEMADKPCHTQTFDKQF